MVSVCSPVVQQKFLWWVCAVLLLSRSSCGGCVQSCCSVEVPVVGVCSPVAQQKFLCWVCAVLLLSRSSCGRCVQSC